ncbi:hypothetical protein ABLE91_17810 [Aquabacter sp. CN5-332]|uniref:hypothetical protein n=1 Tax=Aquabacter sp. CN5-332 TaxID=3156608 RepID=UPI0032B58804
MSFKTHPAPRGILAGIVLAGAVSAAASPAFARADNDPDAYVVNFYTGGGDGVLFAAGTANQQCTNQGEPQITVISASPGVHLNIRLGTYVVTGTDYGYLVCLGRRLPGTIVTGSGAGQATIRVAYPPIGQWYTHTITLPGR